MAVNAESLQGLNHVLDDHRNSLSACCRAVDRCLEANRDNLRGFFEQCFSHLLKQIFGYEGSSWLNTIAKSGQESDAKALVGLLAPGGQLLQAIHTADLDTLIKFEFPLTRLPTHTQQLIRIDAGRKALESWPQYHKHIIVDRQGAYHVHLNVFEYFVFWTAFYVLRSSQSGDAHIQAAPRGYGTLTPSFGTVKKAFVGSKDQPGLKHPYLKLLKLYLENFLPRDHSARSQTPIRGFGSPVRQKSKSSSTVNRGSVLLNVLIEFWLTDGDEPLPLSPSRQGSQDLLSSWKDSAASLRVRSYQPPSDDMIGALAVLCRYMVAIEESRGSAPRPALATAWLPELPSEASSTGKGVVRLQGPPRLGGHASPPAQAFGKRLFRFLWRALTFWPEQQALTAMIDLWLTYAMPWVPHQALEQAGQSHKAQPLQGLGTLRRQPDQTSSSGRQEGEVSSSGWEDHVLANYPFFSRLLPLMTDLLRSRVSTRGDAALRHFCKVMLALKLSPQVTELLKNVGSDLSRYQAQPNRRPDGLYADMLPFFAEQQQQWEAFASAGPTSLDTQEPQAEARLFSSDERSLAANVRDLLQAGHGAAKDSLLHEAEGLARAVLPMDQLRPAHGSNSSQHGPPLSPVQGLKRGSWQDMQYKGDWMQRPLTSSEIGWLVRLLVLLSSWANHRMKLDQPLSQEEASTSFVCDYEGIMLLMRKRRVRINLRPLGEKQTLAWLPICYFVLWILWKLLALMGTALLQA